MSRKTREHRRRLRRMAEYDAKRRAMQQSSIGPQAAPAQASEGSGGHRGPDGLTPIQSSKLLARAIKAGWIKPPPGCAWPIHLTLAEVQSLADERGQLPIMLTQVAETAKDLQDRNPRYRAQAARAVIAMHGQNLSDQHHHDRLITSRGGVGIHVGFGDQGGGGKVTIYLPDNGRDDMTIDGEAELADGADVES